jgi:hypothetical protein
MKEQEEQVKNFLLHSEQYFNNAQDAFQKQEYAKTGELLWGSASLMVKAYALAVTNILLEHHGELFNYVGQLAREFSDQDLYNSFVALDAGHKNFYNLDKDEQFIISEIEIAQGFLGKMSKLLKTKNIPIN